MKKEKQLWINGKMMTLPFFELYKYSLCKKIRTILFPYLLVNLLKQRYISSVKSYKYFNKFITIKTMVLTFVKIRWIYICTIPLIKLQNLCEGKMHFAHHRMPNCIYACILPHRCWKSPERAWILFFFLLYIIIKLDFKVYVLWSDSTINQFSCYQQT